MTSTANYEAESSVLMDGALFKELLEQKAHFIMRIIDRYFVLCRKYRAGYRRCFFFVQE